MRCSRPAMVILLLSQVMAAPTIAGERRAPRGAAQAPAANPLDRVAFAVYGAESSHGADAAMWRPDPAGPQGPMQVTRAAATDVGGGDRFDTTQNREIGRAYLAQLYRRYGDWPDAIAAYNWGIGNFDAWVKAGRPANGLVAEVSAYLGRVLHDSGLCDGPLPKPAARAPSITDACADFADLAALPAPRRVATQRFYSELGKAMRLAEEHAGRRR